MHVVYSANQVFGSRDFPALASVYTFPALVTGYAFSRARQKLCVFPRPPKATRFPALAKGCPFSRSRQKLGVFSATLSPNLPWVDLVHSLILYYFPFSLPMTEVSQQIMKGGGLAPIVAMVSSEHVIMQNEALIALTVMSSTVEGTKFSRSVWLHL